MDNLLILALIVFVISLLVAAIGFLRWILRRMKELGVNNTELAKRMKVSRPYITKLLSGDVNITFGTALRLAKSLKMDFFPELKEGKL